MVWLIFAHCIGDIALQSDWVAQNKGKYWIVMLWHSLIWTGCICMMMRWLGLDVKNWEWVFLLVGHYLMDAWKCRATKRFPSWHLYLDQAWHLLQCWIVYLY